MSMNEVLFSISGQDFTLGQLVIIPAVLIVGYLMIRWLARIITAHLVARRTQHQPYFVVGYGRNIRIQPVCGGDLNDVVASGKDQDGQQEQGNQPFTDLGSHRWLRRRN